MKKPRSVASFTAALAIAGLASLHGEGPPGDAVAVVNGLEILAAEIEVSASMIDQVCRRQAKAREAECTEEDRIRFERELMASRLRARLHAVVEQEVIREFGLSVADEELREFWAETMTDIDRAQVIEAHEETRALSSAIEAVYERGEDAASVWEQNLSQRMSKEVWDIQVTNLRSPERRAVLKRLSERRTDELFEFPEGETEGIRAHLMKEKIEATIDESLGQADTQYLSHFPTTRARVTESSRFEVANEYVQGARRRWWVRQYERLNVNVLDESLESALAWLAEADTE